jgi:hypothetical protein
MKTNERSDAPLVPVVLKTKRESSWLEQEPIFYVVGRDGLHVCRNHEFFRSCVPAVGGPSELEEQGSFLKPRFPRIPRRIFERAVGFFDRVADRHGSEAAVLLAWDRKARRVRLVVPQQTATMSGGWRGSRGTPIGVHYVPPADLPRGWVPFGDIHSHVNFAAYSSYTDRHDETHSAGLHVVVGRIHREPPEIHVEAVVDGVRFALDAADVIEDYRKRQTQVPEAWLERVKIEVSSAYSSWGSSA